MSNFGWISGRPSILKMLHDLANDGGYVAVRRAAEDREGWRQTEKMSKTCCIAENYWLLIIIISLHFNGHVSR